MSTPFAPADLDAFLALLRDGGVESVDLDASAVTAPGVWVRFDGVELEALDGGAALGLTLHLVVPDGEPGNVVRDVAELLGLVAPVLAPLGGPNPGSHMVGLLIGSGAALPALAVPFTLDTTPTEEA